MLEAAVSAISSPTGATEVRPNAATVVRNSRLERPNVSDRELFARSPPAPVIGQSTFRFAIGLPPAGFQTAKSISEMLKQSLPQLPLDVTGRITGYPEVIPQKCGSVRIGDESEVRNFAYTDTPLAEPRFSSNMVISSSLNFGSTSDLRFPIVRSALSVKASRKRFSGSSP